MLRTIARRIAIRLLRFSVVNTTGVVSVGRDGSEVVIGVLGLGWRFTADEAEQFGYTVLSAAEEASAFKQNARVGQAVFTRPLGDPANN